MIQHLPILQVIIPIVAAPLCVFLTPMLARLLFIVSALLMLGMSVLMLSMTLDGQILVYALGGWAAPWGIEYRIDNLSAMILLVINSINVLAMFYSQAESGELPTESRRLYYAAWLLCMTGLNGMVVTNDAFNVFVFLEISSLSTYLLISCGRDPRALLSAYRYLIIGAVGATFILFSIGLLYMQTGTLNISDITSILVSQGINRTTLLALGFFVVGVAIKSAIFPLHDWLPNAYCFAPNAVTALLSGTATKVALYLMLRFSFNLFGVEFSFIEMPLDVILIACAVLGMLIAPLIALRESNLKRMFAWSSIAQISYIALGIGLGTAAGASAALLHMLNHSIIKVAIFIAVGILATRVGTARIKHLGGVAHQHKLVCAVILFGGLGLIGIPGTVGFVSKWYLVTAVIDKDWWWLAVPILMGSLASAAYIWKIVETLWAKPASDELQSNSDKVSDHQSLQLTEWFPLVVLVILALWLGLNAQFQYDVSRKCGGKFAAG